MEQIFKYKHSDPDYYQILGCHPSCSTEQITCEYKNRALVLHPDKQNSKEGEDSFKQLVRAKEILTDPEMRKSYDKWKNSGIAMSFERWQRMGKDVHISMHWINKSTRDLPIASGSNDTHSPQDVTNCSMRWKTVNTFRDNQYDNDLIRKFRNYQL